LRSAQAVEAQAQALLRATLAGGPLTTQGARCEWGAPRAEWQDPRVRVSATAICPRDASELRWQLPFIDTAPLSYRVLVKAQLPGAERNFILEPGASTLAVAGEAQRGFPAF